MPRDLNLYKNMSPFEIKNALEELAAQSCVKNPQKRIFNAGRGNPNFFNTTVRLAFCRLVSFAIEQASAFTKEPDLGFRLHSHGLYKKFEEWLAKKKPDHASLFLKKAFQFAEKNFPLSLDQFTFELCDAALGDYYPVPPRIFPSIEKMIKAYLAEELNLAKREIDSFALFATEGATAAMGYVFNSLKENHLLNPGDSIAIITPIFSPYLEIPHLKDYQLVSVYLKTDENAAWQLSEKEIAKLCNPKIKALFIVNPQNPTCVPLSPSVLEKITRLVKTKRKDLLILTDTVYAPFAKDFHSFENSLPYNTIGVYSFSKYFGATGWRLGIVMLHKDNVLDRQIQRFSPKIQKELNDRYQTVTPDALHIPFIERMSMDSRQPPLTHTSGLSGPQQVMMGLFSLFELLDKKKSYKKTLQAILKKRMKLLYDNLEDQPPKNSTNYYTLINLLQIAQNQYGKSFAAYLKKQHSLEFLFRLAEEYQVICLPGIGFAGSDWSIRISLANLQTQDYAVIGKSIKKLLECYYQDWSRRPPKIAKIKK